MEKIISSTTPPIDKGVMWLDISEEVKWLKAYINGKWVAVNDNSTGKTPEDYYMDNISYGVSWKPNVADPHLTRVGNMTWHKTLPIQNNMKGCIAQMKDGAKIVYYLNPSDWRFRTDEDKVVIENQTLVVTKVSTNELGGIAGDDNETIYTITNEAFSNLRYEHQYLKANGKDIFKITSIDTSTKTATLELDSYSISATRWVEGDNPISMELGAVLNGYDGEVMVEVPEFWIKSWDTDTRREVRITPTYIDSTWEHQAHILVAAYHDTILNTVPEDMGYLSTLPVNSAISVCNIHDYCRGGNNNSSYDKYISSVDVARSMLGKPRTALARATMRDYCRKAGKEILSYLQYKRILYWLYVIEYANFNCQEAFNSALTSEGYRQGGLGSGVSTVNGTYWRYYNGNNPITPNGHTNSIGNNTGVDLMRLIMPTDAGETESTVVGILVPRWHGIENPFGDIWNNVDGVIINSSSIVENGENYSEVYVTDDPALYSDSDYKSMKRVGIELNESGYIKEWDLGNTAEIIPRLNGGNTTQYKCDYHWTNSNTGLRTFILGGSANADSSAGLGYSYSADGVGFARTPLGFRSSCVVA